MSKNNIPYDEYKKFIDYENYILINLKNETKYFEKAFYKIASKFRDNFDVISHVEYVLIAIDGIVKHICTISFDGNNKKFGLCEINKESNNFTSDNNDFINKFINAEIPEEYKKDSLICSSLKFNFTNKQFEYAKFIANYYNCDYSTANLSCAVLRRAVDKSKSIIFLNKARNNEFYINSITLKCIIFIMKFIVKVILKDVQLDEYFKMFIDAFFDIILLYIDNNKNYIESNCISAMKKLCDILNKHKDEISKAFESNDLSKGKEFIKSIFEKYFNEG